MESGIMYSSKYRLTRFEEIEGMPVQSSIIVMAGAINQPLDHDEPFTFYANGFEIQCPAGTVIERLND